MNPHALPKGLSYGTPLHLPVTEQAGLAAYRAHALNQRYAGHLFLAAPYAWQEGSRTPTRWGVQYLGTGNARAGGFILIDWGYGDESDNGAELYFLKLDMARA